MALCSPCGCYNKWGYPLIFSEQTAIGASLSTRNLNCGKKVTAYNYNSLIIDLIFWYIVSCSLVFVWDKVKNKK